MGYILVAPASSFGVRQADIWHCRVPEWDWWTLLPKSSTLRLVSRNMAFPQPDMLQREAGGAGTPVNMYILCLGQRGMQSMQVKKFPRRTLSLPCSTLWTEVGSVLLLGEPFAMVRTEKKQGFYTAGNMRTQTAPLNSWRLTAFPSNVLDTNYLL